MSKTIPVRLSLAQIRHLHTLVQQNQEEGWYQAPREHWERRSAWLNKTLRDAEYRLRNRGKTRPEDMEPPDFDEDY